MVVSVSGVFDHVLRKDFLGVVVFLTSLALRYYCGNAIWFLFKSISRWDFNCLFFQDIITRWQLPGHCSMCQAGRLLWIHNKYLYILHIQMIKSANKAVYLYRIFKARKLAIYFHFPRFCQATSGWSQICWCKFVKWWHVHQTIYERKHDSQHNKLCRRLMICTIITWTFSLLKIVKVTLALTLFTPAVSWDLPVYRLMLFFVVYYY